MSLLNKAPPKDLTYTNKTAALIQRRRLQILVHSYLYYNRNENLISDKLWDTWAKELVELQSTNKELARKVRYDKEFRGFDACSGFNLEYDNDIRNIAEKLLRVNKNLEKRECI